MGGGYLLAEGDEETVERIGDRTQLALPLAATLSATFTCDKYSNIQFWKSMGVAFGTVSALKELVDKDRPDTTDSKSFPSGHTQAAFSGAAYFDWRFGGRWGQPAYALALLTGATRVDADKHFADDVLSGAGIAILSSRFFATRKGDSRRRNDLRFEWEVGAAQQQRNHVATADGSVVSELFERGSQYATARVQLRWRAQRPNDWEVVLAPAANRRSGSLAKPVVFAGVEVPADTALRSTYQVNDIRVARRWRLLRRGRFELKGGLGAAYQDIKVQLDCGDGGRAAVEDPNWMWLASADLGIGLSKRLELQIELEGASAKKDRILDRAAVLRFRPASDDRWNVKLGVRETDRRIAKSAIRTNFIDEQMILAVSYVF